MAQISRPFQIALVAVGLLACVWFLALRGHSSSTSGSGSTPAESPAHSTSAPSAPGVAGLTKDVEKAHGAAKASEQNSAQLAQKSAEASSSSSPATTAPAGQVPAKAPTTTSHSPSSAQATPGKAPSKAAAPAKPAGAPKAAHRNPVATPSRQQSVETQLAHGDIVLLLFWNPKGIDDRAVQKQVRAVSGSSVAVQEATSGEAAAFGTITRGVQLYSTPTVLVLNRKGQAQVISGLTDSYALRQAIAEARKG